MLPSTNVGTNVGHVKSARSRSRIDQVEEGLFIGNMDAATDIVNLELHRVTHIVTVRTTYGFYDFSFFGRDVSLEYHRAVVPFC